MSQLLYAIRLTIIITVMMIGVALTLTIVGAIIGIPMIAISLYDLFTTQNPSKVK